MLNKKMSVLELKAALEGKGDFVQIDNLTKLLHERLDPHLRKFVHQRLAEIYEKKGMFIDSAKMCHNLAIASVAFSEKERCHIKESELYILAGQFDRADEAMKKAMSGASASEKAEIFLTIKQFYKRHAEICEFKRRKNQAAKIYEKILNMNVSCVERREIKTKLLELYDNLGRVKEYMALKNAKE